MKMSMKEIKEGITLGEMEEKDKFSRVSMIIDFIEDNGDLEDKINKKFENIKIGIEDFIKTFRDMPIEEFMKI